MTNDKMILSLVAVMCFVACCFWMQLLWCNTIMQGSYRQKRIQCEGNNVRDDLVGREQNMVSWIGKKKDHVESKKRA